MASFANTTASFNPLAALNRIAAAFWDFNASLVNAHARTAEFEALQSKTDAQLADMGLTRETIVKHVFRDKFYL